MDAKQLEKINYPAHHSNHEDIADTNKSKMPWGAGIMEYWKTGFDGLRSNFYRDDADRELKSGHHALFIPNIPIFHHSILPLAI